MSEGICDHGIFWQDACPECVTEESVKKADEAERKSSEQKMNQAVRFYQGAS